MKHIVRFTTIGLAFFFFGAATLLTGNPEQQTETESTAEHNKVLVTPDSAAASNSGATPPGTLTSTPVNGVQRPVPKSDCNQPAHTPLTTVEVPGHPFSIISTGDGCWLFVSLTSEDPKLNGVAVLQRAAGNITLEHVYAIEARKGRNPLRPGPSGMVMTHDGQLLIAANDNDLIFLDVQSMISGKPDPVIGHLSDGASRHTVLTSNGVTENSAGSLYVNVTKDDSHLFVSDEYAETISVINLAKARLSNYDRSAVVGQIPVGVAPIALTFSPDERWLYTTSAVASPSWNWPVACPQDRADRAAFPKIERPEGAVVVVDVQHARTDPAHSVVANVPAGCGSVRLAIAPDGSSIWVSARRDDAVLGFDTSKLLKDPLHSRIAAVPVGTAPVGIAVLSDAKRVVVANSNRIAADPNSPQNVSVIDITRVPLGTPRVTGTFPVGAFPREFSQSPDGRTLFLGNYLSNTIEVIDEEKLSIVLPSAGEQQTDSSPDAQAVLARTEELNQAFLHADMAALDRIIADDCLQITQNGAGTKAEWLGPYRNGTRRLESIAPPKWRRIRLYGDVAVLTSAGEIVVLVRGERRTYRLFSTRTWVKRSGQWYLVLAQNTPRATAESTGHAEQPGEAYAF